MGNFLTGLLSAGTSLLGGAANIFTNQQNIQAQEKANQENRDFQLQMYDKQRADALADVQMQNSYNSPAAQMARLKASGLNPNLVYDNGGAATTSATVRSSSAGSNYATAPKVDYSGLADSLSNGLMLFQDLQARQAQTDNLKANSKVLAQDATLKAAQTAQVGAQTAMTQMNTAKTDIDRQRAEFDLGLANSLRETTIDAAKENVRRTSIGTDIMLNQNEREAAMNSANLSVAFQKVANMRIDQENTKLQMALSSKKNTAEVNQIYQNISNLKQALNNSQLDGMLKQIEVNWRKSGVTSSDDLPFRLLSQILDDPQSATDILKGSGLTAPPAGHAWRQNGNKWEDIQKNSKENVW